MVDFNFSNFYKLVIKNEKNVTQKEAGYILFTGERSDKSSVFMQESTISAYISGKKAISNFLIDEINKVDDEELAKRISMLNIQNIAETVENGLDFIKNSTADHNTKKIIKDLNKNNESYPELVLGRIFKETIKWKEHKIDKDDKRKAKIENTDGKTDISSSFQELLTENRDMKNKLKVYSSVGIIDCIEKLEGSNYAPIPCMKSITESLDFMGVGGEKWVKDKETIDEFEEMLVRIRCRKGKVRFLIIDPEGSEYKDLYRLRRDTLPTKSYERFLKLMSKYKNLEVRLYNHLPTFRMQFADKRYLAVSKYYFEKEDHQNAKGGWETPHLILANEATQIKSRMYKGSLYGPFVMAFNYYWEESRNIKDWEKGGMIFARGVDE